MSQFTSDSETATASIAAGFAEDLKPGDVVLLTGDLGAGKSVFARAVIRAISGDHFLDVPSPTYTLVQMYDTPRGIVWHFDLYRLTAPEQVYELGWEDALANGIVLIEWPERLATLAPAPARAVSIRRDGDAREISII